MTSFWLLVCAGCAASAAVGFSLVRFALPSLPKFHPVDASSIAVWHAMPEDARSPVPVAAVAAPVRELPAAPLPALPPEPPAAASRPEPRTHAASSRSTAAKRHSATTRRPAPTAPEPDAEKLALWARQVKAGERKMSIATDGCRVTWDRTCKHGHPTWLVRLGYLERPRPPRARQALR
jgi:hypothetical protein